MPGRVVDPAVAFAPGRLRDGIATGRIHLGGTAAGEHPDIGVRADHGDGANLRGAERQLAAGVLQQHGALLGHALGQLQAGEDIRRSTVRGIVEQACGEHRAGDAAHHVVEPGHGNLAALDRLLQRGVEILVARHLDVEAGQRGLNGGMRAAPVRDDEAREPPLLLQYLVKQVVVLARVVAVHQVVGAHERARAGFLEGDLEGQQVALAHGPFVHLDVDEAAAVLLVVESVMLDVADDTLLLEPLHVRAHHAAGQDRVLAAVFEVTAVAWFAIQVDSAAQRHGVALVAQLAADERAVFAGQAQIPGGDLGDGGGQRRRIASENRTARDAHRRVGHLQVGHAQARNAGNETGAAERARQSAVGATEVRVPASPVHQRQFLGEGHLGDHQLGPPVGRQTLVHPGSGGFRLLSGPLRHGGSGKQGEQSSAENRAQYPLWQG